LGIGPYLRESDRPKRASFKLSPPPRHLDPVVSLQPQMSGVIISQIL